MGAIVAVSIGPVLCRYILIEASRHPSYRTATVKDSYAAFCDRALRTVHQVLAVERREIQLDAIGIAVAGEVVDDLVRATCCLQHLDGEPLEEDFFTEFGEIPTIVIGQTEAAELAKECDSQIIALRDDHLLAGAVISAKRLLAAK